MGAMSKAAPASAKNSLPLMDLITIDLSNPQSNTLYKNIVAKLQELKDKHNLTTFENDPDRFEKMAAQAWEESVPEVVKFIQISAPTTAAFRVRNIKYGDVFPTSAERCTHKTLIPYAMSAGLNRALGCGVVGWREDRLLTNSFFHDIRPVKGGKEGSNGAGEPLNFHQDMSYEFEKAPEYLTLACLREGHDNRVRTPIIPNRRLYEWLEENHPEDMEVLKNPSSYKVKLPPSMGGAYAPAMPLLTGDKPENATFWLRVNYDRIEPQTEEAFAAFERLRGAMIQMAHSTVHLVDGDLLLIGNKKCLHRRTYFDAQFDADDRLLVRNYSKKLEGGNVPADRFMDPEPDMNLSMRSKL
jgi:hypothetical protein